jgi:hypothetical protein
MRNLLDEPVDAPLVQPDITQTQSLFSIQLPGETGYVFGGLGCPNGCDFCATSHAFAKKHIKFLPDGASILRAIERLRSLHPGIDKFWINDEDFLLDFERGNGFLEAIRESSLPPLSLSIFSSVKALSRYNPAELVEMGVDWVWVGYEGRRAGFSKMQGRSYRDLFSDLHNHGISVLASMIIGFDYQTRGVRRVAGLAPFHGAIPYLRGFGGTTREIDALEQIGDGESPTSTATARTHFFATSRQAVWLSSFMHGSERDGQSEVGLALFEGSGIHMCSTAQSCGSSRAALNTVSRQVEVKVALVKCIEVRRQHVAEHAFIEESARQLA